MSDRDKIYSTKFQDKIERSTVLMFVVVAFVLVFGGIVEIVPLFYLDRTMTHLSPDVKTKVDSKQISPIVWQRKPGQSLDDWKPGDGVRPYKPLELAGREIYIREGCYLCHSQMIRPFRDEKDRYGQFSVSSESMYDHPFQWGSKRTGPDLARVGGKYSDEWHRRHLMYPREVVPESVMPNYAFLDGKKVDVAKVKKTMEVMNMMPFYPANYTEMDIASSAGVEGKTEMDAVIAYLQGMGNHIKFTEGVNYRD
ncbi:cytochrome-c oxidase, cbb3-type subunit II [Candidatus Ferrigenium straubiae]|jgi:cytochrome c oxidase cbb3-type subunit 2|uniref:cytochrome-c oxidase, cbb3-type subunit II n=1 Tax=Candidatus Ferrigenium straubiae TaxID=2919506 RepID=UPI003F4AA5AB